MPTRSGPRASEAALGFRSHSGWAALVAVAGPAGEPKVIVRRRFELSRQTPRQPFHAAEGKPFAAAEVLIRRSTEEAANLAERAVEEAIAELRAEGHEPVATGLLLAAGRPLPALREVLASHALIHAAEGELFRDVLRQASRRCGLRVTEVRERDLDAQAVLSRTPGRRRRPSAGRVGKGDGPAVDPGREAGRPRGLARPGGRRAPSGARPADLKKVAAVLR